VRIAASTYGLTLAAVAVAGIVRWLLDPVLGDHLPFPTFFAAIAFAAWIGGWRPALLATALGFLFALFFFIPPRMSVLGTSGPHLVGLVVYLIVGLTLAGFGEAMRISQYRLAEQGERLRTTLASIGDAVITTDSEGLITNLNAPAESLTGWTNDEAVGQPLDVVFRIVNETTRKPVENPAIRSLRDGVIVGLANQTVLIAKDGTERAIDDSAAPIRCKEGQVVGCVLIFRDVTEQRYLQRRSSLLASVVQSSEDAIISKSLDGTVQTWNVAAERLFNYSSAEIVGRPISLLIPADRAAEEERILARLQAGERIEPFYTVRMRSDGSPVHVSLTISPIRDEAGEIIGASKMVRDITERKLAEEKLRESEARYRAIGEAIDFGVWMCDSEGRNTYASESFLRLVGITQEECSGDGWGHFLHPDEAEATIVAWKECVRTGGVWDREHRFKGVDGQWHSVLARGVPVKDEGGRILGWVGINLDISRLKQAEEALREGDRRKDEFLATLAHELRNPLAPVRNAVQLLHMKGPAIPELQWARDVIDRQMQAMTRLIDDLMDLSRISRNKLELRKERVELATVVQGAVETSRPLIEEQGHELVVSLPPEPIFLNADVTRLAQVFLNLLNNAAKYTERGGRIDLRAERQGSDMVVSVKDTGIGISSEHLSKLFTMFSQVEGSLARSQGGLGIGLALVKRLVEMHGGSIEAHSEGPGKGSEFLVRLPIVIERRNAPIRPVGNDGASPNSKLRILVVDDNRDAASTVGMLLKLMGNTIRTAHDGEEAVQAAGEFRPQVVLLDIGLPKMNGYDAASRIRQQEWGTKMILVAVTGWGQEDDRRKSKEAGFDHHMVKPVDPQSLMKLLAEFSEAAGRKHGSSTDVEMT